MHLRDLTTLFIIINLLVVCYAFRYRVVIMNTFNFGENLKPKD